MIKTEMKIRNSFLVIVWSIGLFILMHTWQYLGAWIASIVDQVTLDRRRWSS